MSADCDVCRLIEKKEEFKLVYEDALAVAFVHEAPLKEGQVILMSKQHHPILEQVPDEIFTHLMSLANIMSITLFEGLQAHGTNIVINNGIDAGQVLPHMIINVIPRSEGDGVKLDWEMKKASDDSIKLNAELIEKFSSKINLKDDPAKNVAAKAEKKEEPKHALKDSENYKVKHLRRIP